MQGECVSKEVKKINYKLVCFIVCSVFFFLVFNWNPSL